MDLEMPLVPPTLVAQLSSDSAERRVKSGARVVSVLEYFHQLDRPARAVEIGRALGLAPSSANDLLKTLVDVGYLEFDEDDKSYFPGLRAAMFGRWLTQCYPNVAILNDLIHQLSVETGDSVVLFTHRHHQVQVLAVSPGKEPAPANIVEGASLPVFGTAAGGAVLMVKSHEELYRIARRTFRTKSCSKAIVAMGDMVQTFKQQGYACSLRDDIVPDNWAIALPLPVQMRSGTIVMGVGGPNSREHGNVQDLVSLARERISRYFH